MCNIKALSQGMPPDADDYVPIRPQWDGSSLRFASSDDRRPTDDIMILRPHSPNDHNLLLPRLLIVRWQRVRRDLARGASRPPRPPRTIRPPGARVICRGAIGARELIRSKLARICRCRAGRGPRRLCSASAPVRKSAEVAAPTGEGYAYDEEDADDDKRYLRGGQRLQSRSPTLGD